MKRAWLVFVLAVVAANAFALRHEIGISRFELNDGIFHYTVIERMVEALESGESPLDFWVPEWTFGYPVPRTYQPLAHLLVAVLYFTFAKTISLLTLFVWTKFLLLATLPLSVYASARLLRMSEPAAAAAALISPLIVSNGLFGIEYNSYVWSGTGLFTQAFAMHLLLLALGFAFRERAAPAGVLLGLTFLSHFIYGFVGAVTVLMMAVLAWRWRPLVMIAAIAFAVSAFELVPALSDSPLVNHSRWEPSWKWDSFGASRVLGMTFSGELLDHERLPILTLLAGFGVVIGILRRQVFLVRGAALWLLLFFGRSTWGPLFSIPGLGDIQLHRLSGAVHIFAIFLGGLALCEIWERVGKHKVVAVAITAILLLPVVLERRAYLAQGTDWGESNLAAYRAEEGDIRAVIAKLSEAQGRIYPGLAAGWGKDFRVGYVPLYGILSTNHIPAVAFLYHAMALTSDIMVLFDEKNPAHYELFNVSNVLSDSRPLPEFITPEQTIGRFRISTAPGRGYFDVVCVSHYTEADRRSFFDVSSNWLQSDWVAKRQHILLDFGGIPTGALQHLTVGKQLPEIPSAAFPGEVVSQSLESAVVRADEPAYVLFKMTYHPNWRARVDGTEVQTAMLTPGFVGIPIGAGEHRVEVSYEPGRLKVILLVLGILATAVVHYRRLL